MINHKSIYLVVCLLFSAFIIGCSETRESHAELIPVEHEWDNFDWQGNPYHFSKYIVDTIQTQKGDQMAATAMSFIGDVATTLKMWDGAYEPRTDSVSKEELENFTSYSPVEAKPWIIKRAEDYDVVIINEAHHIAQHRTFTTSLLEDLYNLGYRHLGLEALFSNATIDSIVNLRKHPILKNGIYTKEPQFAYMLRRAKEIGFELFPYEAQNGESGKFREIGQAEQVAKYMQDHPGEKILLHCGYDHAAEGDLDNKWEKAMAGRLSDMMNLDPLTINQTTFSGRSDIKNEDKYYRLMDLQVPMILLNEQDESFSNYRDNRHFDLSIFHPRYTFSKSHRAEWLLIDGKKRVDLDLSDYELEFPVLVYAMKSTDEVTDAVPLDIQETKNKKCQLVLQSGEYKLLIQDQKSKHLLTAFVVD